MNGKPNHNGAPFVNGCSADASAAITGGDARAAAAPLARLPVSCFIIAKDEEDRIAYTLESVQGWVNEIVVVIDSASSDKTAEIAALHGAKVHYKDWEGYGAQKRFGEEKCRCPWLLNLDADESVSPALREEICLFFNEFSMDPPYDGMRLDIRTLRRGEQSARLFAPSNNPVRLYRRAAAGFKDSTVHDSVEFTERYPRVRAFSAPVYHRCFRSYAHAVEKINYYSDMQAADLLARGKRYGAARLLTEPFFAFFKAYILRRYLFLGVDGIIESFIYSFARTLRMAKLRELRKREGK